MTIWLSQHHRCQDGTDMPTSSNNCTAGYSVVTHYLGCKHKPGSRGLTTPYQHQGSLTLPYAVTLNSLSLLPTTLTPFSHRASHTATSSTHIDIATFHSRLQPKARSQLTLVSTASNCAVHALGPLLRRLLHAVGRVDGGLLDAVSSILRAW